LQGSGTFAVEAMLAQVRARAGVPGSRLGFGLGLRLGLGNPNPNPTKFAPRAGGGASLLIATNGAYGFGLVGFGLGSG